MLKLTKKADYGLIALKHLTLRRFGCASAKDIADTYGIPVPMLSKVLQILARSGFLQSEHGTHGGYRLSRDPHDINAYEVVRAIDGPIVLASCFTDNGECAHLDRCNVRDPLRRIHEGIIDLLRRTSMAELAADTKTSAAPSAILSQIEIHDENHILR